MPDDKPVAVINASATPIPPGAFKFVINPFQPDDIIIVSPALYRRINAEWKAMGGDMSESDGVQAIMKAAADSKEG